MTTEAAASGGSAALPSSAYADAFVVCLHPLPEQTLICFS